MKILLLSFYFPPDLCAGSFRASALYQALSEQLADYPDASIDVITTMPNRYREYAVDEAAEIEPREKGTIYRCTLSRHSKGFLGQIRLFYDFAKQVKRLTQHRQYDLVIATSSRLFTAALGAQIAKKQSAKLYLDIRDLFSDTFETVMKPFLIRQIFLPIFRAIETHTYRSADKINVVSPGFIAYIQAKAQKPMSLYTNGIDPLFLAYPYNQNLMHNTNEPLRMLYVGNIGLGQGLSDIVPSLLEIPGVDFQIIGAGNSKQKLVQLLGEEIAQKILSLPVEQKILPSIYDKAHILFVHLAKGKAFEKVLPSKLFEYAATGRPILAGLSGEAKRFVEAHIPGAFVFEPGDSLSCKKALTALLEHNQFFYDRSHFRDNYQRTHIMKNFAKEALALCEGSI